MSSYHFPNGIPQEELQFLRSVVSQAFGLAKGGNPDAGQALLCKELENARLHAEASPWGPALCSQWQVSIEAYQRLIVIVELADDSEQLQP